MPAIFFFLTWRPKSGIMFTIENQDIKVTLQAKGAELTGLFSKQTGLEYMWNGDPKFWSKQSPVLFPIVVTLKNNSYIHDGNSYQLSRHGLARDRQFVVENQQPDSITFLLSDDDESALVFPF